MEQQNETKAPTNLFDNIRSIRRLGHECVENRGSLQLIFRGQRYGHSFVIQLFLSLLLLFLMCAAYNLNLLCRLGETEIKVLPTHCFFHALLSLSLCTSASKHDIIKALFESWYSADKVVLL